MCFIRTEKRTECVVEHGEQTAFDATLFSMYSLASCKDAKRRRLATMHAISAGRRDTRPVVAKVCSMQRRDHARRRRRRIGPTGPSHSFGLSIGSLASLGRAETLCSVAAAGCSIMDAGAAFGFLDIYQSLLTIVRITASQRASRWQHRHSRSGKWNQ